MRGYKVTLRRDNSVYGSGISLNEKEIFVPGETYSLPQNANPRIDGKGYHFCRYIWDLLLYVNLFEKDSQGKYKYRVFEVSIDESDIIIRNRTQLNFVTNRMKILQEIPMRIVSDRIGSLDPDVILYLNRELQLHAIRQGIWHIELSDSPDEGVRAFIIGQLAKMDTEDAIKEIPTIDVSQYKDRVESNLYTLIPKFLEDKSKLVRNTLAVNGYAVDQLVNDPDPFVRVGVVRSQNYWDYLLNDPDWSVRYAIIHEFHYGAEFLKNDPNETVRVEARKQLGNFDYHNIGNDI